jgi:hypothetical protein
MKARRERSEAAEYYFTHIDKVGEGNICQILETQARHTLALLQRISDTQSLSRHGQMEYQPGRPIWFIEEPVP